MYAHYIENLIYGTAITMGLYYGFRLILAVVRQLLGE